MSLKVLSYHDVLLRQQDVDLLGSQDWLNDQVCRSCNTGLLETSVNSLNSGLCVQIISFCFEYLDHEVTASDPDILMIGPSMAYLLGTAGTAQIENIGADCTHPSNACTKLVCMMVADEAVAQMITEPLQVHSAVQGLWLLLKLQLRRFRKLMP